MSSSFDVLHRLALCLLLGILCSTALATPDQTCEPSDEVSLVQRKVSVVHRQSSNTPARFAAHGQKASVSLRHKSRLSGSRALHDCLALLPFLEKRDGDFFNLCGRSLPDANCKELFDAVGNGPWSEDAVSKACKILAKGSLKNARASLLSRSKLEASNFNMEIARLDSALERKGEDHEGTKDHHKTTDGSPLGPKKHATSPPVTTAPSSTTAHGHQSVMHTNTSVTMAPGTTSIGTAKIRSVAPTTTATGSTTTVSVAPTTTTTSTTTTTTVGSTTTTTVVATTTTTTIITTASATTMSAVSIANSPTPAATVAPAAA